MSSVNPSGPVNSGKVSRRGFLQNTVAASAAVVATWTLLPESLIAEELSADADSLRIAPFRFDVTPPNGHPCCGGWIKPVVDVDDPLEAIGYVLLGMGQPIVICAVDWTGLLNEAHIRWREMLADAAGTTPERVAVQCVHQHNAPFACLEAERIVLEQGDLPDIVELDFYEECLVRGKKAVQEALKKSRPVTHIASSQAKISEVASNRRVSRTESGQIKAMRGSSCRDEALRALPEGTIDPYLKTVTFYDGSTPVVCSHYYAVHPMSYYGDGRVSSDFVGLARKKRQAEQPECCQIYFTGCAGNVSAGKYNDGSKEMRAILTDRIYQGMVASEKLLKPEPIEKLNWRTVAVLPPTNPQWTQEGLQAQISDKNNSVVNRNRPAYTLSWFRRVESGVPIILSCLRVNGVSLLHLPAECFIEYQLEAQKLQPEQFVATAAYGDGGPWYIPTQEEYPNGGYEVSVAFCAPKVDQVLCEGMAQLLG